MFKPLYYAKIDFRVNIFTDIGYTFLEIKIIKHNSYRWGGDEMERSAFFAGSVLSSRLTAAAGHRGPAGADEAGVRKANRLLKDRRNAENLADTAFLSRRDMAHDGLL